MKQVTYYLKFIFLLTIFFLVTISAKAQFLSVNSDADDESDFSPEQLIREILIQGDCADVSNISSSTFGNIRTNRSYGFFRRPAGVNFPFEEGIILSSGNVFPAGNSSSSNLNTTYSNAPIVDEDLTRAIGEDPDDMIPDTQFFDVTIFEFDFVPTTNEISFRYIMASAEYQSTFPCSFADSFAFLLKPAGSTDDFVNIATVPGTDPPVPVAVTTVHAGFNCPAPNEEQNPAFYAGNSSAVNYNGQTVVLTASATVTPNITYRIKLIVADASDAQFDTAVFLEAGSFNLGLDLGDDFVSSSNNAVCGDSVELTANLDGFDYQWFFNDTLIPGAVDQTYTATAGGLGAGRYKCEISSAGGTCTGEDEIDIEFATPASINPAITDLLECDPDGDLTEVFDLTSKDSEILNGLDPTLFEVRYFRNDSYLNLIMDPANFTNDSPTQTVYAQVRNRNNTNCFANDSFIIQVTGLPIPTQPVDIEFCDDDVDGDDTNGFIQSFLLSSKDAEILGTLDPAQFEVSYHLNEADAQTGTNPIDKNNPYTNAVANQQAIYYRVENVDNTACFQSADDDVSTIYEPFNLVVNPLPVTVPVVELRQCDDDTDGFSPFNLTQANEDISVDFINETFTYYETLADAQNDVDPIANTTAYINEVQTSDVIWARATTMSGCFRIAQIDLIVATNSSGVSNFPPRVYNQCDDFLDINGNDNVNNNDTDGVSTFDFSDVTDDLLLEFPINERPNLIITYYRTEAEAFSESNPIANPSNYRNIGFPNSQNIYVRVDNVTNNDCIGLLALITLNVDPVPVANPVADLELCDDSDDGNFSNGIVQIFNIESQTPIILGGQDPNVYTVTYHLTSADASAGTNAITNTTAYTNNTPNQQTIYVRVTHNTDGCFTDRSSFDLIVNPLPDANFVPDLEICDNGDDGSTQNGITNNIDVSVQTTGILGSQDPNQFSVTYHTSLADAQAGTGAITGLWENTIPFTQTVYIRVLNGVTGCVNGISNFNVIINSEPTVEFIEDFMVCDDPADGDDTNGFVQNIDLDSTISTILGPNQDEDDFTVTFHESQSDATIGINALTSPYANTTANQQTIFVRVVNDDTGCVNDDLSFDIIVNPLPDFQVTSPQIVCLNGPELTLTVENPADIYDYVWTDPEGNEIVGSLITITTGGLYSVTATTVDGTNCTRTREIQVTESIIATITDNDVTIVDDSENNSITIDPTNLGIGDYEYALEDENGILIRTFQDDPLFENLEGGFYTILVRDKNGCGVVSLDVSVVVFPSFFTPNNDGVNDTWAIRGANSIFFPNSEVNIFNRFGKVVAQISIDNPGWDGTFNGKVLPSDDYWFSIRLVDRNGVVRERSGNMSLLRRE